MEMNLTKEVRALKDKPSLLGKLIILKLQYRESTSSIVKRETGANMKTIGIAKLKKKN